MKIQISAEKLLAWPGTESKVNSNFLTFDQIFGIVSDR